MQNLVIYEGQDMWEEESGLFLIPVNCVGVMGCGLAKDCKERYPHIFENYRDLCKAGDFKIGTLKLYLLKDNFGILLFPTKKHWRNPSELEWIEYGLRKLGSCISRSPLKTIRVPPLGCGAGKLKIDDVRPMIEKYLCQDDDNTVVFYQP